MIFRRVVLNLLKSSTDLLYNSCDTNVIPMWYQSDKKNGGEHIKCVPVYLSGATSFCTKNCNLGAH